MLNKTNIKSLIQKTLIKFYTEIFKPELEEHTHKYAGSSDIGGAANSSVKLATPRAVNLTEGLHSLTQYFNGTENLIIPVDFINEAYIQSGGKNLAGKYSPIDAAMVSELGANRLAFVKDNSVTIESSTDGGATWNTIITEKPNIIFSGCANAGIYIGNNTSTNIDKSKHMIRLTIDCSVAPLYSVLNKFVILVSSNGSSGCYCTIQGKSNANANTDTWTTYADKVEVKGWTGYNVINTSIVCGGTGADQNKYLRFVFGVTSHSSSTNYPGLQICKIMGFGGVGWQTPSWLAGTGHIYKYDSNQNATFPNKITAEEFSGKIKAPDIAGALSLSQGGTGKSSWTVTPNAIIRFSSIDNCFSSTSTKNGTLYCTTTNGEPIFGTLPIAQGGTGSTTADGVRTNLSIYSKSEVDTKLNTKSETSHTHKYASSSSIGGSATSAEKVNNSLLLKLGSNASIEYDGSIEREFYVNPSSIGAANANHTHNYAGSSSVGGVATQAAKTTGTLTLQTNGTSAGTFDGSTNKTVNITASSIGAATSSHTHNYAGSSSNGGSATSAVKLTTARTLTIGNKGKTFDGSSNVSWSLSEIGALPLTGGTLTGKLILDSNSGINMANGTNLNAYDTQGNAITLATLTPINIARFGTTQYPTYISTSSELRIIKNYDSTSDGYGNLRTRNIYFRNSLDDNIDHIGKIETNTSDSSVTLSSAKAVIIKGHYTYSDSTNCGLEYKRITNSGVSYPVLRPLTTAIARLGSSSLRWYGIYSSTAVDVGSDRRLKEDIINIDENLEDMFMDLRPVSYKLRENDDHRRHNGFIAQEVEDSMNNHNISYEDFAALNKSMPDEDTEPKFYTKDGKADYEYSLKYTEFIPLNTHMIQKAFKRIEELENRILELESK